VLVFEDLHWADDGLLDFVDYLVDWAGDVPMLVVGSARRELPTRRLLSAPSPMRGESGNRHAWEGASSWLAATYMWLPVLADAAVTRVEQLRQAASGETWAEAYLLGPLSILYAHTGRFGDARLARRRSIFCRLRGET
jgi:hypothetical protein